MIAVIPFAAFAAAGSLVSSIGGGIMSFRDANRFKNIQKEAEEAADISMANARKALGVNFFEELGIQKEKYELEREANLMQAKQATTALQEAGSRELLGGIGRVALAQQKGEQAIRTAMGKEMSDLQMKTAQEESRLRDVGVQLDLAEVAGAQEAAARAEEQAALQRKRGLEATLGAVQQGLSLIPLYQQNIGAQKAAAAGMQFSPEQFAKFGNIGKSGELAVGEFSDLDFASIGGMSNREFRQFKQSLTPMQQAMIFGSSQFTDAYQNIDTSYMNPFQLR